MPTIPDLSPSVQGRSGPARGCVCGGRFILGPFGARPAADDPNVPVAALAQAIEAFLRRTGGATEDTLRGWVHLRGQLARTLALAALVEQGEVKVVGWSGDEPRFGIRDPEAGEPA